MSAGAKCRILSAVRAEDASLALSALFDDAELPKECELLDYKREFAGDALAMAELCRDVIALFNSYGGVLVFGVSDDLAVVGCSCDVEETTLRQKIRHYFGADVAVRTKAADVKGKRVLALVVPKRSGSTPAAVCQRAGPMQGSKTLFGIGNVYFRAADSTQLIRDSADFHFLSTARRHDLDSAEAPDSHREKIHNLPDRNAICPEFVGRTEVKNDLWLWLSDRLSRYRVIAGPGGFGKTSAAFSFAEDLLDSTAHGFEQILWLSAKKKQFAADKDTYIAMPYSGGLGDSFQDFGSLLDALAGAVPITKEEWEEATDSDKIEALRTAFLEIPSFVVIDDLDSLAPPEQRRTIELVLQVGSGNSRFLITTRNNFLAPPTSTTKLPGLAGADFEQLVGVLQERYGKNLTIKESESLLSATEGSPLFVESIFRLLRLGFRVGDALQKWKGKDGEAVRAASFKRELDQLPLRARRALFAMSRSSSASLAEICTLAELEQEEADYALQELDQLFLYSSEEIGGQSRYRVADNLRRVLEEVKAQVIPDYREIERRFAAFRKDATTPARERGNSLIVASAIRQSMAQLGHGDTRGALETVDDAIRRVPTSADLAMVKGRIVAAVKPLDVEAVRRAFDQSFKLGKREARLFEVWIRFETEFGNANAAVDVAAKGESVLDNPGHEWLTRSAAAFFRRGDQRLRRGEIDDARVDFKASLDRLSAAMRVAPSAARASIKSAIERAGEAMWNSISGTGTATNLLIVRVASEAFEKGDRRPIWIERSVIALNSLAHQTAKLSAKELRELDGAVSDVSRLLDTADTHRLSDAIDRTLARCARDRSKGVDGAGG